MNRKLPSWSVTVALGGFLFGFDTAVIYYTLRILNKRKDELVPPFGNDSR